ncbi:hypothetical protein D3C80_1095530 [compost metagenome]
MVGYQAACVKAVFQTDAIAIDAVFCNRAENGRRCQCGSGVDFAEHIGIGIVFVTLVGQLYAVVAVVVPAALDQHVFGAIVLRVGVFSGTAGTASATEGFQLIAIAATEVQQTVHLAAASSDRAAAQPAIVRTVVTGFQTAIGVIAIFQIVCGILGQVADGAADGVTAVQRGRWAANDFHSLHGVEVDVVASHVLERAEEKALGNADAVDLGQHAVAVDAADVEAGQAEAAAGAADRNARFVAHQILDVVGVVAVDFLFGMHAHGARNGVYRLLDTSSGHCGFAKGNGVVRKGEGRTQQQQGEPITASERRSGRHGAPIGLV